MQFSNKKKTKKQKTYITLFTGGTEVGGKVLSKEKESIEMNSNILKKIFELN